MDKSLTDIEPKLKEILYRCLEDIKATKAAVYLMSDLDDRFQLVTQYGFRNLAGRESIAAREEVIDRLIMKRAPFFVNGLNDDSRFSELLFHDDTSRMLVAPIYSRGRLVGYLDMRDKAAKEAFGPADAANAQKIVDQFLEVFAQNGLFGQKTPTLTNTKLPESAVIETTSISVPAPASQVPGLGAVEEAKKALVRGVLRNRSVPDSLSEAQVNAAALVLPSILALPGVVMAAFSSFGKLGGFQVAAAQAEVTEAASQQFQAKLVSWLQKRGEPEALSRSSVVYPNGTAGRPIEPNRLVSLLSAPVLVPGMKGLVLTVAFEMPPSPVVRGRMNDILRELQQMVEYSISHEMLAAKMQKAAEKLLEPDFATYPLLAEHSRRVSDLAERLARFVGLPERDVENVRLAALLHDVGMRQLEYRNLYRKQTPTPEELKVMREHPLVGAVLVADSPVGPDVAAIVIAHHERPDGTGYPNGLTGEMIPVGARIVHICEAYDAMTAPDSYQAAVPAASALGKIKRAAGAQFDENLAAKFVEMMSAAG